MRRRSGRPHDSISRIQDFEPTPRELVKLGNAVLAGDVELEETFELLAAPQRLANGSDSGAGFGMGRRSGTVRRSENG